MNITLCRYINRSTYVYIINWKKQIDEILYAVEVEQRIESNMRKAISKAINRTV